MQQIQSNSIFWIEVEKIQPNPFQPRREFDESKLSELAESIRQYGILQPLIVTRKEIETDTGMDVLYELIAGERRLRASKLAGLFQVPVIVRHETDNNVKLEIAIIENLQREDLNSVDKARAFRQLIDEFGLKHGDIAKKVGKSREFVSNTVRMLNLPDDMLDALAQGKIAEGHTRPLLMLIDRPDEQKKLFIEMIEKKTNIREAELAARRIAHERARQKDELPDPETRALEEKLSDDLGTRVQIEKNGEKGKIVINFFSKEEFNFLLDRIKKEKSQFDDDNTGGSKQELFQEEIESEDDEALSRFTI